MEKDRRCLVLYTSSICNLKCRYCYIDKNPALVSIDKILEESFKGDYYFEFIKKMFPSQDQLTEIQFWGGEPMIGLTRTIETIKKVIPYYHNFNKIMMSTNFTLPNWIDIFFEFLDLFNNFPDRKFHFCLQLSIDGTKSMNDSSRGEGVTDKFSKNFYELMNNLDRIPKNVTLEWFFKPTLDNESIRLLQTKQDIISYYQFFEVFYKLAKQKRNERVSFFPAIPNTASPSPHTKEDGILFANLCRLCREIEKDSDKYFNFYKQITPYIPRHRDCGKDYCGGGNCGVGTYSIGLLPNNMISTCHNGFVDLISDYKKMAIENEEDYTVLQSSFFKKEGTFNRMTLTLEDFSKFEVNVYNFYNNGTTAKIANIASLINLLARVRQIDQKYESREESLKAARFINSTVSYCLRDNINTSGTMELFPIGHLRLLLNGAKEYLEIE